MRHVDSEHRSSAHRALGDHETHAARDERERIVEREHACNDMRSVLPQTDEV